MITDRSDGHFETEGICPICEKPSLFRAHGLPLRSSFICLVCQSSPRERTIIEVIGKFYPNWRDLRIHESSPGPMISSKKLRAECAGYVASEYDPKTEFGKFSPLAQCRSEDLENQTFADASFDLVITQDVFEHMFHPDKAIREIARTLRPGGAHICTVPIVMKHLASVRRAKLIDGEIQHCLPPEYHVNPISHHTESTDNKDSLVTVDWGYDIASYFTAHSGLVTTIVHIDDVERGMRAEINEVLVCQKFNVPTL